MSKTGPSRAVGLDIGAETIKAAELVRGPGGDLRWTRRAVREHHKEPGATLRDLLSDWGWEAVDSAAVTGRMSRQVALQRVPIKQAQISGHGFLHGPGPATVVSIGSHGFSVLEIRSSNVERFRENSRCSQGTGNFLRQLVERFDLSIEEASEICASVEDPAPLSGRCPVILKTDMTHLANKGEPRERILAGLYDAVCENVQVLIKPRVSPPDVVLIGGVARSERIRANFAAFLERNDMRLAGGEGDDFLFFEALGAAVVAAERAFAVPALDDLFGPPERHDHEPVPPLSDFLHRVRRLEAKPRTGRPPGTAPLVLGFDIGSTGSKIVALDAETEEPAWEAYTATNGAPVQAARSLMQQFVESDLADNPVIACGATGSGREIVGSLLTTCYGPERIFVINEIAAHAEGALHYDGRVDTIFEIGGQDAKYIRLSEGRVIDAAMNEACSAGTGSFIEEQGRKFSGVRDVVHLGEEALEAKSGVSLGQHCSVFMAEIIDAAVADAVPQRAIIAGIYDSIIQNYLNRVKGSRSVGDVVFCQGMPFSSDALAAAVARRTGSEVIVPPGPGTVGALGIGLLAVKELDTRSLDPLDPRRFLAAEVLEKDVFVCRSTKGCGGAGNRCRIDRIKTLVDGKKQVFTWGGGCSLYDKGTGKKKLPDRSPDPFREREELIEEIVRRLSEPRGRERIALTDEFALKSFFPLFATYLHGLGFDLEIHRGADQSVLKRGIEDANVPFCAPMQQYHGLVARMAEGDADRLFLPMLRGVPRVGDEHASTLCPIVQGSADMMRWDLGPDPKATVVSPVVDFGRGNFRSRLFVDSCESLARELGATGDGWRAALDEAVAVQEAFESDCLALGRRALEFCEREGITPIVVIGRSYTIYNTVLNSNVPAILREQGAIPIPVDCYPVDDETPVYQRMYWGYGQRNLRAANHIRRTPGVYSLYCSNYSCGPDSFNVHFFSYIMSGKPFCIIETDGHSGDAGTKTRVEAFLYCVHGDRKMAEPTPMRQCIKKFEGDYDQILDIRREGKVVLVPLMGPAKALAACMRGIGLRAEALPQPDREALALGRRHTSGKECLPTTVTLGSLLQRLERDRDGDERFSFFMPCAYGPCRFGAYNTLHKIVIERLGWGDRVSLWSPADSGYFDNVPDGFSGVVFAGFMAEDIMLEALYHVRPVETSPGAAREIHDYYHAELMRHLEGIAAGNLSAGNVVAQVMSGRLFGVSDLLRRALTALAAVKEDREVPSVLVVGEIYVRCDPFANDYVIDRLEARGIRCKFAPFNEWIEYTDYQDVVKSSLSDHVTAYLQASIQHQMYRMAQEILGWHERTTVQDSLGAAAPYLRESLSGEAILTLGGPIHEWREGRIDAVVSVGPLECMPNKIAEAQFFHVAEREGLHSLTLHLNGDPLDPEVLDNFAYEVRTQFERRRRGLSVPPPPLKPRPPIWRSATRNNPQD